MDHPDVDIVTVTHNSAQYLPDFFAALRQLEYPRERLRVIAVDNASVDGTNTLLREQGKHTINLKVIESPTNEGFGAACNRGAAQGSAPFILFLNPDAAAEPLMLGQMVARARSEENIGLVDVLQEPVDLEKWYDRGSGDTDWCSGGAVLARREAFAALGGFDPFFFLYCEDVDLSWRMWLAGWRCVTESAGRVRHETTSDGTIKPITMYYSIRNSFAMRFIYDSPRGIRSHLVRGLRYLASPRTVASTRRAVFAGFWFMARKLPHLLRRRRAAQADLAKSSQREHFVFNEWFYGRYFPNIVTTEQ